eukprot:363169-Chlamydomonas_euryale.AAC.34
MQEYLSPRGTAPLENIDRCERPGFAAGGAASRWRARCYASGGALGLNRATWRFKGCGEVTQRIVPTWRSPGFHCAQRSAQSVGVSQAGQIDVIMVAPVMLSRRPGVGVAARGDAAADCAGACGRAGMLVGCIRLADARRVHMDRDGAAVGSGCNGLRAAPAGGERVWLVPPGAARVWPAVGADRSPAGTMALHVGCRGGTVPRAQTRPAEQIADLKGTFPRAAAWAAGRRRPGGGGTICDNMHMRLCIRICPPVTGKRRHRTLVEHRLWVHHWNILLHTAPCPVGMPSSRITLCVLKKCMLVCICTICTHACMHA